MDYSDRDTNSSVTIALLGDSILDNAAYTAGEPAVTDHLQNLLGTSGRAYLCALDGAVTREVASQLEGLPAGTTHLVISTGGNDALQHIDLLTNRARTVADALEQFIEPLLSFEQDYASLLEKVLRRGVPAWCCTVYNGMLDEPYARVAPMAIALFNDVIYRLAGEAGFPVIELRHLCTEPEDYANPIEPSGVGGGKIARAILEAVLDRV